MGSTEQNGRDAVKILTDLVRELLERLGSGQHPGNHGGDGVGRVGQGNADDLCVFPNTRKRISEFVARNVDKILDLLAMRFGVACALLNGVEVKSLQASSEP